MDNFEIIDKSYYGICYYDKIKNIFKLKITHNAGFFSCCSKILDEIINHFNKYNKLPDILDTSLQFELYKPSFYNKDLDISSDYFKENDSMTILYNKNINFSCQQYQFTNYKLLNFDSVNSFIKKYFEPSVIIRSEIKNIEDKYNLDYDNICVLFYRGNDKETETNLPNYKDYINIAKEIQHKDKNIIFLIQSDESEFIKTMKEEFCNNIIFEDEIRHISNNKNLSVDMINKDTNLNFSKKFLAITYIMSKCKYVICNSGNCSLWICLYRNNFNNVHIYCNTNWV